MTAAATPHTRRHHQPGRAHTPRHPTGPIRRTVIGLLLVAGAGCGTPPDNTGTPAPVSAATQTAPDTTPNPEPELASNTPTRPQPETFTGTDIWVDPTGGADTNSGRTRRTALRTVSAAWRQIPANTTLTRGYRILLAPGRYPQEGSVNYWENRRGTATAPIILTAADGPHTATFEADINMYNVSHFSLIGVDIIRDGDAFHCEQCEHILIKDAELSGGTGARETVKVNQSQHIFIENADIHGAEDNAIDFVAVQYGHVTGSRISDAGDWCMYAKGGSAYLELSDNEVFDCGTGGITAGQGTGFEFMTAPWLRYEAYGIRIIDNVIHDTDGAGLGVAGGYNIVLSDNTLYNVGARSHVVEFVRGRRGCDGDTATCDTHRAAGGWGSRDSEEPLIPNRHIFFYNNIIINPARSPSQWQHLQIDGPIEPAASSGVPSPSRADDGLHIAGNVFLNGGPDMNLGTGDGCADTNRTCNERQIRADNAINTRNVALVDPSRGNYTLTPGSTALLPPRATFTGFVWDTNLVPDPSDDPDPDPADPDPADPGIGARGVHPTCPAVRVGHPSRPCTPTRN
jgi:hypothetical protein